MSALVWTLICATALFGGMHLTYRMSKPRIDALYKAVDALEAELATLKTKLEATEQSIKKVQENA